MKKNIGKADAIVRITLGLAIAAAGFYYKAWWGYLAAIPILTAWFSFCPLYKLLGISTAKKNIQVK
jgi:hypothetical protein